MPKREPRMKMGMKCSEYFIFQLSNYSVIINPKQEKVASKKEAAKPFLIVKNFRNIPDVKVARASDIELSIAFMKISPGRYFK